MGKLLFWIVLLVGAWFVLRLLIAKGRGGDGRGDAAAKDAGKVAPAADPASESMRQCAHCGVFFPASEAVASDDGRLYCSRAHHDAAGHASGG